MMELNRVLCAPVSEGGGWNNLRGPAFGSRIYKGVIRIGGEPEVWSETPAQIAKVEAERRPLALCLEIRSHSPTGFAWGYGGSGPAQLALALLVDALGDTEQALACYQDFKREHVAKWGARWSITAEEIRRFASRPGTRTEPARFASGRIVATSKTFNTIESGDILLALHRHLQGDWGELDRHGWQANEQALDDGSRLLSAYISRNGTRFWIITEADRSSTTILLPED